MLDKEVYESARERIQNESADGIPDPHRAALRNVHSRIDTAEALLRYVANEEPTIYQVITVATLLLEEAERVDRRRRD